MTAAAPSSTRYAFVAALLLSLAAAPAALQAADAQNQTLEDHLSHRWYITEVVVFQRPQVQDRDTEEELVQPPRPLPASLTSFLDESLAAASRRLEPATRACLTFPVLDLSSLPPDLQALQLAAGAAAGEPANDRPAVAETADTDAAQPPPAIEPQLAPDPLLDFLRRLGEFEHSLEAASYRRLPADTFTLTTEAQRLVHQGGYKVLLHVRWLQPVPPRDAPQPLWVEAGPRYGDHDALEGSFAVTVGHYLHFHSALYYTEPLLGRSPLDRAIPPPDAGPATEDPSLSLDALTPTGYMQIHQSRRLRSGELHYIDHPKLGILVRIDPAPIPESLSEAYSALEESDQ